MASLPLLPLSFLYCYWVGFFWNKKKKKINIYQKRKEKIHPAFQQQQDFFITGNCMKTALILHKPDRFCLIFELERTFMNDITKPLPSKILSCWDLAASTPRCWALHQISLKCLLHCSSVQSTGTGRCWTLQPGNQHHIHKGIGVVLKKHWLNNRVWPITIITLRLGCFFIVSSQRWKSFIPFPTNLFCLQPWAGHKTKQECVSDLREPFLPLLLSSTTNIWKLWSLLRWIIQFLIIAMQCDRTTFKATANRWFTKLSSESHCLL